MLGRHREAHARLTTALEQLQDAEAPEAAALMIVLAFDGLFRNEFDSMREAAQRALDVARRLGDRPLTATAAAVLTLGCAFAGAITQADAARREAVSLVEALSDEELAQSISAGAHLATAELYLDRYEEAAAHAERARAVGRATGQHFPTLIPTLASVYVMRGSLAEGARAIDDSIEAARLASNPQDIGWGLHVRSSAALAAGEVDAAVRAAEEAVELTRGLIEGFITAYPGLALGAALLAAGQPARAAEVLLDRCGGEELPLIPGAWRAMAFEVLACSYLQLGRREDAARAAALAEAWAAAVPLPTAVCWARRAAAAVALDAGEPEAAAAHALAAAEAAERAGAVVEEALSRTLAGRALAAAGDVDGAAGELERAAATLDDCGALRYRDAAERELRKLGRRIHRRTRAGRVGAGVDSLTQRELQVALLVVDRKTNAEIAADLFLSLKTVESHMRNLFRKLDVSSRVEVARVVERDQGADQGGAPMS
jgi:ATP/maltotriose-dependent transcriptional regulator MalT